MPRLIQAIAESGFKISEVVSGMARGADTLGEMWALEHGVAVMQFPALWNVFGKRAGMIRNKAMACYADALIALWDGQSPGTEHMIREASSHKIPIHIARINDSLKQGESLDK